MRVLKTIGIVIGIYFAAFIVDLVVASGSPDYQGGVTVLVLLSAYAFMATKVGYRWFDCFLIIIPFYGIFLIFRIAHRIALLPNRDWSERAESA